MFAWLTGVKLYALLAVGLLILGLAGAVAWERQQVKLAQAEALSARKAAADLTQALKESEADKAQLVKQLDKLNLLVKSEHDRQAQLAKDKQRIADELDALKTSLPQADQDCFSRAMPDAVLERLREPGHSADHESGVPADPGKPAPPLHEVGASG